MSLRIGVLLYFFFTTSAATLLSAQQNSSGYPAMVGSVQGGDWYIEDNLLPPSDPKQHLALKPLDAFHIDKNSCVGTNDKKTTLRMLINDQECSYSCEDPADSGCTLTEYQKSKNQKQFSCVRRLLKEGACLEATQVSPHKDSDQNGLMSTVAELFEPSPKRYITPEARGLEAELAEGVLLVEGPQLDLSSALHDMDPGTYGLRLESLAGPAQNSRPVTVHWNGHGSAAVAVPGIKPGLYRLEQVDSSDEPTGSEAWVLLSGADRFHQDSTAFQSALEIAHRWSDQVDERATVALLRAYLEWLSRQPGKAK